MNNKKMVSFLTATSLIFASVGNSIACTSLVYTDANGNGYHARTMEYSAKVPTSLTYFPAGTKVISATPTGAQGLTFDTKYAILGMTGAIISSAKQVSFAEGANDQGLSFSMNWLNGTTSPTVGNDSSKVLAVNDLGAWILVALRL